jgi:spoIIIJ-associated protein
MNRNIEITAKSEDEARQIAEGELNEDEKIIDSELLSAPARGIFGFVGKQEFKMRFTIGKVEKTVPEEVRQSAPKSQDHEDYDSLDDHEDLPEPRKERISGNRKRREHSSERRPRRREPVEENIPERPKDEVSEEILKHESYQKVFDLIREVAENVGVENVELNDYMRDGAWVIEAAGENVSQLIGKRGKNLDALQYLMNIVLNRGNEDRIKLVIDAQGYREKRYRNLMSLASRMCKKALSSRRPVELEPMSTLDRRTVHMALKDKEGIDTYSKGAEPMRKVVIAPSKKAKNNMKAAWQPVEADEDDHSSENNEAPGSVPMFIEEDA